MKQKKQQGDFFINIESINNSFLIKIHIEKKYVGWLLYQNDTFFFKKYLDNKLYIYICICNDFNNINFINKRKEVQITKPIY